MAGRPTKYDIFNVSKPWPKIIADNLTREYVSITCPYCTESFTNVPFSILKTQKSTDCKKHLRVCYKYDGPEKQKGPPLKKQKVGNDELLKKMENMEKKLAESEARAEARAEERHKETLAMLTTSFALGSPPATTCDELVVRQKQCTKRKEQRSYDVGVREGLKGMQTFKKHALNVAKSKKQLKMMQKQFHPDRAVGEPPETQAAIKYFLGTFINAASHRRATPPPRSP